jgi:hypothetical protein
MMRKEGVWTRPETEYPIPELRDKLGVPFGPRKELGQLDVQREQTICPMV